MSRKISPSLAALALAIAVDSSLHAQTPTCFDPNVGADLFLSDDDTAQALPLGFTFTYAGVAYTDICVCSNGYIEFGPVSTAGSDFSPTETELLTGPPRLCPMWEDLNPSSQGNVLFQTVPASGTTPAHALVTWANVHEYGTTNAISMQLRLDANNAIAVTYGSNAPQGALTITDYIVGASPGGNATSNPVTFATRPFQITQDNFAEVIPTGVFPYAGVSMLWSATTPGYIVTDISCTPNNLPGPAQYTTFGVGCPTPAVLYEEFTQTNDLSGLGFHFFPNGTSGYTMLQLPSQLFTGLSNNLSAGDDSTHAVALPFPFPYDGGVLTQIVVSSNGFLYLSAIDGGNGCCNGDVYDLLNNEPRIAGHWMDLYPPGGGGVYADLDPLTGDFCVTWDQVPEFFSGPANTFQIALKPSGAFEIRYGTVVNTTHVSICGFSQGHGATDPGSSDLSAMPTASLSGGTPLMLTNLNATLPQLGGALQQEISRLPSTANIAVLLIGLFENVPPMDLGFLGAPGCSAHVNFLTGPTATLLNVTLGASTAQYTMSFPNSTVFNGVQMLCQGACDDTSANQLGVRLSNAARLVLGW